MELHAFVFTSLATRHRHTTIDRAALRLQSSGQMAQDEPFWDQTAEFYSPNLPYLCQLSQSADNTHGSGYTSIQSTATLITFTAAGNSRVVCAKKKIRTLLEQIKRTEVGEAGYLPADVSRVKLIQAESDRPVDSAAWGIERTLNGS